MLPVIFEPRIGLGPRRLGAFERLSRDLDRMFAPAWDAVSSPHRVDVWEDEDHMYLAVDVPGLTKDDIEATVEDGVLSVKAQREDKTEHEGKTYHIRERRFGQFERRFRLPETVDDGEVNAALKDGVLTLTLNKREEQKPRKIEVETD
jgi:HSP20 family protein